MSKAVQNLVRKMTSQSHAGRGGNESPFGSGSRSSDSDAAPKERRSTKRQAESPAESLRATDDDPVLAVPRPPGADKTPCVLLTTSDSTPAGSGLSEFSRMLKEFKRELRDDLRRVAEDIVEPLKVRVCAVELRHDQQREELSRLTAENRKLRVLVDKCAESVNDVENVAKSTISNMEKKVANINSSQAGATTNPPCTAAPALNDLHIKVSDLIEEATESRLRSNNVILRGRPARRQELPGSCPKILRL
eukprot:scpid83953/ scgid9417/ 